MSVRSPAVAGSFYPDDAAELENEVEELLGSSSPEQAGRFPKALVVPHAGYRYSGSLAAKAYSLVAAMHSQVERVVIFGPNHTVPLSGAVVPSHSRWLTPLGATQIDRVEIERLAALGLVRIDDAPHLKEHCLEVQLPFLQKALGDEISLVPIVVGQMEASAVAELIRAAWGGRETLIIVSSDLSHFLDYGAAQEIDAATAASIISKDPEGLGRDSACGRYPLSGLLQYASETGLEATQLGICNSGDTAGNKNRVVGYGSFAFYEAQKPELLVIAGAALRAAVSGEDYAPLLSSELDIQGKSFVTLTKQGRLRGCIGSLITTAPLGIDVAVNARKAALRDPRFSPVVSAELSDLEVEVSVLGDPSVLAVESYEDLLRSLHPGIDGLTVRDQQARATFLPAVWETLSTSEEFVAALWQKAGLASRAWSPSILIETYTTETLGPIRLTEL